MVSFGPFTFDSITTEGNIVKYRKKIEYREDAERFVKRLNHFKVGTVSMVSSYSAFHITWTLEVSE